MHLKGNCVQLASGQKCKFGKEGHFEVTCRSKSEDA